jgi:hypothetical protein
MRTKSRDIQRRAWHPHLGVSAHNPRDGLVPPRDHDIATTFHRSDEFTQMGFRLRDADMFHACSMTIKMVMFKSLHRPLNTGGRFVMNAITASRKSSVLPSTC